MLNTVIIEGYVTSKIWRWGGDLCFRLASYRDAHQPQKPPPPLGSDHDQSADYLTVRVIGGAPGGIPVAVHPGQLVRVHGFLGSRPWRRTLTEIVEVAQGQPIAWSPESDPAGAVLEDEVVDVIVERLAVLGRSKEETVKEP